MKRDDLIKRVADLVGKPHTVDLKRYDRLILVDVYRVSTGAIQLVAVIQASRRNLTCVVQNIMGMSIVGSDYEDLKRYNIAEIYEPTPPKPET